MKVRVLLLVVSIASLLAALLCATGIIIQRGGGRTGSGVIMDGPQATGIIVTRGGPVSGGSQA